MFSLLDTSTIITRLKLPQDDGLIETISGSIKAASPFLEAATQSRFDSQERTDIFLIDPWLDLCSGGVLILKLSSGFVRHDSNLTITVADTLESLQLTANSISPLKVEHERGHIFIAERQSLTYVKISYYCGFESLDEVPEWLQECAYIQTLMGLSCIQLGDDTAISQIYKDMRSTQGQLLDAHIRSRSYAIAPLL